MCQEYQNGKKTTTEKHEVEFKSPITQIKAYHVDKGFLHWTSKVFTRFEISFLTGSKNRPLGAAVDTKQAPQEVVFPVEKEFEDALITEVSVKATKDHIEEIAFTTNNNKVQSLKTGNGKDLTAHEVLKSKLVARTQVLIGLGVHVYENAVVGISAYFA